MTINWIDVRRNLGWMLFVCGLMVAAEPAHAQDAGALAGRIERLERDLAVLQRQAYRDQASGIGGGGMSGDASASLFVKISQIEEQMRDLTGQIEQLSFKIDQTQQRLDRMSSDVDYRFQSLERPPGANGASPTGTVPEPPPATTQSSGSTVRELGATAPAPAPSQPAPAAAGQSAAEAYRDAFNLLKKADYPAAEAAFRAFLKQHGDTEYAGNAQYWLGETYYVRGQFDQAAVAFADGYRNYRKGAKAPDSLLKLGFSMRRLNQNDKACAALDQFLKEFAGAPKVQVDLAQKTRAELKCR